MPKRKNRIGFTLVELLVVITIIGLLMAILLPAVGRARSSARRTQCINQMRQLGTASMNYASSKGYFTGYVSELSGRAINTQLVSWFAHLLPMTDRNDLHDAIQAGDMSSSYYVDLAICPSDVPDTKGNADISYVINSGTWQTPRRVEHVLFTDPTGWRDAKANGIGHNLAGLIGRYQGIPNVGKAKIAASNLRVSPDYISSNDGASSTVLFAENVDAGRWWGAGYSPSAKGQVGMVWLENVEHQLNINEGAGLGDAGTADGKFARPSSNHSEVVIVTFADGHTATLNDQIEKDLFARLMTPDGKKAVNRTGSAVPWQAVPVDTTGLGL